MFAVVHVQTVGKDDVGNDAPLVQDGQRVDAVLLQHLPGAASLRNGQTQRVVVGGQAGGLVRRAAPQEKFADIPVGQGRFQLALRRDEQDALAGFIQLAQCLQHGGVGGQEQFFYLDQREIPLSVDYRQRTAWQTRSQSSSDKLVEQGRLTIYLRYSWALSRA